MAPGNQDSAGNGKFAWPGLAGLRPVGDPDEKEKEKEK
jgi:hypothetical protein